MNTSINLRRIVLTSVLSLALIITSFGLVVFTSNASDYKLSVLTYTGEQQFTNDWAKTKYGDSRKAIMKYGFETFLVNEDFTQGMHKSKKCKVLINDFTKNSTNTASAGNKAYADITHVQSRKSRVHAMDY